MIKEIKLNGVSAIPTDYQCTDGELDVSLNLVNEDGCLHPLHAPSVKCLLNAGERVLLVHRTSMYAHYIIADEANRLYWIDEDNINSPSVVPTQHYNTIMNNSYPVSIPDLYSAEIIGNTICILSGSGMHYILWKDNEYKYLGTHIPDMSISFGLQGHAKKSETDTVSCSLPFDQYRPHGGNKDITFPEGGAFTNLKRTITNQVLSKANKLIADEATNSGRFLFPFFVRYAFRLYDGTLVMHSSPILMIPSSENPLHAFVHLWRTDEDNLIDNILFDVRGLFCELDYVVESPNEITELENWDDIVKSVDVFVSAPLYSYNQAGEVEGFTAYTSEEKGYTISRIPTNADCEYQPINYTDYAKMDVTPLLIDSYGSSNDAVNFYTECGIGIDEIKLPQHSADKQVDNIRNCGNFYLLKSFKISELKTTREIIEIPKDYLQSLTSRELMTDDYDSRDTLIPNIAFPYNSRLNISGITKQLAKPYAPAACLPKCTAIWSFDPTQEVYLARPLYNATAEMYAEIKYEGKIIVTKSLRSINFPSEFPFIYGYYPNTNAYNLRLVLKFEDIDGETRYKVYFPNIEPHPFLNGSVFFAGWEVNNVTQTPYLSVNESYYNNNFLPESIDTNIDIKNKLYTSEVNNPFVFPVLGINTIGVGEIIGIRSATKALSQGQFGQFPLYAFCTDGVWALEVSATGTFSAKQPISRDVCNNADSITQIDDSVLFTTDRGIMLISGSQLACISDIINNDYPLSLDDLPKLSTIQENFVAPFSDFIKQCRMVYDYRHQRIIIFNPTSDDNGSLRYPYAYVFARKSTTWSMMTSCFTSAVNDYPYALANTIDNKLVSFFDTDSIYTSGLIVSRPIKFDAPDNFKAVHSAIQRGRFKEGYVKTILYGSRNLTDWHLIKSSTNHKLRGMRGTPYKYFRIVSIPTLSDKDFLVGVSFDVQDQTPPKMI